MAQQGKEEAEDIRSSQQRFRHTEKSCMPMAFGKGEAVVEIGEMEGVDEKISSRSSNLASVPRSVVSAAPKKKNRCANSLAAFGCVWLSGWVRSVWKRDLARVGRLRN